MNARPRPQKIMRWEQFDPALRQAMVEEFARTVSLWLNMPFDPAARKSGDYNYAAARRDYFRARR